MKPLMRWALCALLLAACGESTPTEVAAPRDRFEHAGLLSERESDTLVFVFDHGRYGFFQVQADTVAFWEAGRYWLDCDHPVECRFTVGTTEGRNAEQLDYKGSNPIYVGPDGVEIGSGIYEWLELDEALAMVPKSHRQRWQ